MRLCQRCNAQAARRKYCTPCAPLANRENERETYRWQPKKTSRTWTPQQRANFEARRAAKQTSTGETNV